MKPREFWISNLGGKYVVDFDEPSYISDAKTYHVREVSPELDAAIEAMREALKFFSDVDSYELRTYHVDSQIPWSYEESRIHHEGSERAQKALEAYYKAVQSNEESRGEND